MTTPKATAAHPLGEAAGSTRWIEGEPPLKRILMLWNGKALFGPIAFQTEEHRAMQQNLLQQSQPKIAGVATHYLIIPKTPAGSNSQIGRRTPIY